MGNKQLTHHNHYVPRFYLRRWSSNGNSIWDYRVIVENEHAKYWKTTSLKAAAAWDDLYTQHIDGEDNDSVEDYLCDHFETPTSKVLEKLDSGQALFARDFSTLADYWLIQYLRTPAFMGESFAILNGVFDPLVKENIDSISKQLLDKGKGLFTGKSSSEIAEGPFPLQPFEVELDPEACEVTVRTSVGRSGYLAAIGTVLNGPVGTYVRNCNWSIVRAPVGSYFYTSDNPAVVFGLRADGSVAVDGMGLGQCNADLILPLDPQKVLLAQVGSSPLACLPVFSNTQVNLINEAICKSAFRHIYSRKKDDLVRRIRPRAVNRDFVQEERDLREAWNQDQAKLEREHEVWLANNA